MNSWIRHKIMIKKAMVSQFKVLDVYNVCDERCHVWLLAFIPLLTISQFSPITPQQRTASMCFLWYTWSHHIFANCYMCCIPGHFTTLWGEHCCPLLHRQNPLARVSLIHSFARAFTVVLSYIRSPLRVLERQCQFFWRKTVDMHPDSFVF